MHWEYLDQPFIFIMMINLLELEDKATDLLYGDRDTAYRLVINQSERNPYRTLEWWWEKVIHDLIHDRDRS